MFRRLKDAVRAALKRKKELQNEPAEPRRRRLAFGRKRAHEPSAFNRGTAQRKHRAPVHLTPSAQRHRVVSRQKRRKMQHEARRRNRHTAGVNR